jgi:type I restriction enzyme S subunit
MRKAKLIDLLESWDAGAWGEPAKRDGVSVLRSTNFKSGGQLSFENQAFLAIDESTLSRKRLFPGDILLERSGGGPLQPVGRVVAFWGCALNHSFICGNFISRLVLKRQEVDPLYLLYVLLFWHMSGQTQKLQTATTGIRNLQMSRYLQKELLVPDSIQEQERIAAHLQSQLCEVEKAREANATQFREAAKLASSIVFDTLKMGKPQAHKLGDVLGEVKAGIGEGWKNYPVLGATRAGLAPAKERPGKNPERYKPAFPGTVFYNPMRIMIGSIAFVDGDDKPGITSPDYVALKGKPGLVDSRWFYYWLRSPLGEKCINSLARGTVRERMLFNRLAEGEIELPDFPLQEKASKALAQIKPMRAAIVKQKRELELIPQKLLTQVFQT